MSWFFRVGVLCFGGILFVGQGLLRNLLVGVMIPATLSLFGTSLFLSIDVYRLLITSYEFWFTSIINAINWIAFALALGDARALMSFMGWFSFQIVISVDASYRTMSTIVRSTKLGIPVALLMCAFVSLRAIDNANFFVVSALGHRICDAADIMNFTAPTLAILLAKMVVLKNQRMRASTRTSSGHLKVACVIMKVTLKLVQANATKPQEEPMIAMRPSARRLRKQRGQPYITRAASRQRVRLSPLSVSCIDARHTLLPCRFWLSPPAWIVRYQTPLRLLLYTTGAIAYLLLVVQSVANVRTIIVASRHFSSSSSSSSTGSHTSATCDAVHSPDPGDHFRSIAGALCTALFIGMFGLFCQRQLLRLLLRNFDFVFSLAQVAAYNACILDMLCWNANCTLVIFSWMAWLVWTLSVDALTPLAKREVLRLPPKLPAFVLASALLSCLGMIYVVLFLDHNGLRYRTLVNVALSPTHTFAMTTKSVMVGRVATIALWCSRQVYVLAVRKDDELHLVRGLVEYDSPYGFFPAKHTKHQPARADDDDL